MDKRGRLVSAIFDLSLRQFRQQRIGVVGCFCAEFFFDAEELVVFGYAFAAVRGAGLDLARVQRDDEVGDGGVFRLAGAVGDDGAEAVLMRELDRFDGLGQRADLVQLDQDCVACAHLDAFGETLRIRDEEVVADDLELVAEALGQLLPAVPVFLVQRVFQGDDWIFRDELRPVVDEFRGGVFGLGFRQNVLAFLLAFPLAGGGVNGQREVFARLIARLFDGFHDVVEGFFRALEVRREAAFVADGGGELVLLEQRGQRMVDLGAPLEALREALCADRHDHEFLHVDVVGGMGAAVQDVHHRHGQDARLRAAEEAIEGLAFGDGGGFRGSEGDGEDRVRAEFFLAFGAVGLEHGVVDRVSVASGKTRDGFRDRRIYVFDGFQHAFAVIAFLVAVAKLQRFVLARGRAAGARRAALAAVAQRDLGLDGGVAARVHDFAADDGYDFRRFHSKSSNLFSRRRRAAPRIGYSRFLLYHNINAKRGLKFAFFCRFLIYYAG